MPHTNDLPSRAEGAPVALAAGLCSIAVGCPDPHLLAASYRGMTGLQAACESEDFAAIPATGVWLTFHRVPDYRPPAWPDGIVPQQVHPGFSVDDLEAAEQLATSLGAVKAETQPSPTRWRVMTGPAGHPFCVSTIIPSIPGS